MLGIGDLAGLDPAVPAPPLMLDLHTALSSDFSSDATEVAPLVGGQRNYLLEVALDGGQQTIYADDVTGVLEMLIPGYGPARRQFEEAAAVGDRVAVQAQLNVLLGLRADHARSVRMMLQSDINQVARLVGVWDGLSAVEQEQCRASAAGQIPTGVPVAVPFIDPDGRQILVEAAVWSAVVGLVVDRVDYGVFHPEGLLEPEPTQADGPDDGVLGSVVVLDSTDEAAYLASLDAAGWVDVAVYDPSLDWS